MGPFTHNNAQIVPQPLQDHADVLKRFASGNDARQVLFATTIIAREFVEGRLIELNKTDQKIQAKIPDALARTTASNVLKSLLGKEPTWREVLNGDGKGGFVDSVDRLRETKLAIHQYDIYRHILNTAIADLAESQLRKASKDGPLPADARFFFDGLGGRSQMSYAGKKTLTNVVIVTRAEMKPSGPGNAPIINAINEAFDPGAKRNEVAAQLMLASHVLHETPQAFIVYIPVLEPGDVLYVQTFENGFFWDIKQTKVSIYSDSGSLRDKVLMEGGPVNDLKLSAAERARSRPVEEKLVGPVFESMGGGIEIVLKPDAGDGPFERCVPVGRSYLLMETKDTVEKGKPLTVVAKSKDAYVAVGPKKMTGNGLVLVPKNLVEKVNDLNKQNQAKLPERGKVQPVKQATWIVLKPPADGSNTFQFATGSTLLNNICTKTGRTVEMTVQPNESLRAVAVWDDLYVVFPTKPVADGATIVLVPKTMVKEIKTRP
jgi:hypothetical protein